MTAFFITVEWGLQIDKILAKAERLSFGDVQMGLVCLPPPQTIPLFRQKSVKQSSWINFNLILYKFCL